MAVADAVAHAGPPPEGLDGPGGLSELRGVPGYTGTPVHLAPLDVGALALPPRGFQPRGLDELVGPSFACEIVQQRCCQRQRKWRLSGAVACRKGLATLVWATAAAILGTFACSLRARCNQFLKEGSSPLWSPCRLKKEWRPHHRRTYPKDGF